MFQFGDLDCDLSCGAYTLFAGFLLFSHLFIMSGPLKGWANGNFLLFGFTGVTLLQYVNSVALVWNPDWYWNLNQKYRLAAFMIALGTYSMWLSAFIGEAIRAHRGNTPLDTNQEIIMAYLIVLCMPQALLSLATVILASASGDVSPTGHHTENESSDPTHYEGHLPQESEITQDHPFDHDADGNPIADEGSHTSGDQPTTSVTDTDTDADADAANV